MKLSKIFSMAARTVAVLSLLWSAQTALAQHSDTELAKQLSNPVANLISVPKYMWDTRLGEKDANRSTYLTQPVVPFSMNTEWNLITRTIIPLYINAQSPSANVGGESGMGDITQSFFLSPKAPTAGGWIWGAGSVFLYPTASNDVVGREKWGAGPTFVF